MLVEILANSIFIGFKFGIDILDKETGDPLTDGTSLIKNNIYQLFTKGKDVVADGSTPSFASADILKAYLTVKGNTIIDQNAVLLNAPCSLAAPNFTVKSGSSAATGATF